MGSLQAELREIQNPDQLKRIISDLYRKIDEIRGIHTKALKTTDLADESRFDDYLKHDGSVPLTGNLNFGQFAVINFVLAGGTEAPTNPVNLQIRMDENDNIIKIFWDGEWRNIIGLIIHTHETDGEGGKLDHTLALTNIGTNTHNEIDSHIAAWLQNGFPNKTDSTISFVNGTRTFTIAPTGGSFYYFINGVKYIVSASDSIVISDTEGPWYIYYNGSTLTATVSPNHATIRNIIKNKAWVATVFWDADNSKGQLLEERHGYSMSPATHLYLHETVGTRYDTGLALNTISADENGSADSHAQFGIDAGQIFDEDIEHTLNAIASNVGLQIWHRDTSGWAFTTNVGFSMLTAGTGRLAYDNSGTLTEVTNGDFVLCHIFATNFSHLNPVIAIGQAEYPTKKAAQEGALTEIVNILSIANISPELKPIASVIFQTKNTFSNAVKAIIVSTDSGDDYVDFRTDAINPSSASAQSHGTLLDLDNPGDHTWAFLVDGTRIMSGELDMGSNKVVNVIDPTADQDAATKKYVDDNVSTSFMQMKFENSFRDLDMWILSNTVLNASNQIILGAA